MVPSKHLIINTSIYNDNEDLFRVPVAALFQAAHSLITLELSGMLKFDFPKNDTLASFGFPNLKKLTLYHLFDVYPWLETLIESSPLLEDLEIVFDLFLDDIKPQSQDAQSCFNVFAPNLESLLIRMLSPDTRRSKICIDAPILIHISIFDCNWCCYLVQNPTRLANAWLTLSVDSVHTAGLVVAEDYVDQVAKFVAGLSSVRKLNLHLDPHSNVYTLLHGLVPVFPSLKCLTTSLENICVIGWKDLLLSLQCFPNLKHLEVHMDYRKIRDEGVMVWSAPDSVPDCLVSKLKTIKITGLNGILGELRLLTYILSNATTLKKLEVYVRRDCGRSKEARLRNACKFCWSLFELPRRSPTCEVYFC